jgi:hypothetical protein
MSSPHKWLIFYDAKKWSQNFAGKNKTLTFAVPVSPSLSTMLKSGGVLFFIANVDGMTESFPILKKFAPLPQEKTRNRLYYTFL